MNRTINSSRNIAWGMINQLCLAVFGFGVRTAIIYKWGNEYIGLNALFNSVFQMLNLAELGFSSAIIFSMYRPIAENNINKVNQLLSYYRKCYKRIGIVIVLIGFAVSPFLKYMVNGDVPSEINIYGIYFINLFTVAVGYFLFSYKSSVLIAYQRNDIISNIGTILFIIRSILQLLAIFCFNNYYLYLFIILIMTVLNNLVISYYVKKMYPSCKSEGEINITEKKHIKSNVSGLLMQKIGSIILVSADNIVISAYIGLTCVGIYSNYIYIISFLFSILSIILTAIQASVGNSISIDSVEKNYKDFEKFNFIYSWIVSWMAIALLCLFQPVIRVWLGEGNLLSMDIVLLIVLSFYVQKICEMVVVYKNAAGIWNKGKLIPLCAGLCNLFLNILLVNHIGLVGVILSTVVSLLLINTFGYVYILYKYYFGWTKGIYLYLLKQGKYSLICVLVAIITYGLCFLVSHGKIYSLVLQCIICLLIPNILFYFVYKNSEVYKESLFFGKYIIANVLKRKNRENE